jgi:hypothetical protein
MTATSLAAVLAIYFAPGAVIASHAEFDQPDDRGQVAGRAMQLVALVAVVLVWPVFVVFGTIEPPDDDGCW